MRALYIAVMATVLTIPSVGYSQDDRAPGPIGPNLGPSRPAQTSGSPPGMPSSGSSSQVQPFVGYPATAGSEAPNTLVTMPVPGGLVSAIVNGHHVVIDPTTNVIVRVLN
jgi:hypothetical protein